MADRVSVFTPGHPEIGDPVLRMIAGVTTASLQGLGEIASFSDPHEPQSERWRAGYRRLADLQKHHLLATMAAVAELLAAHAERATGEGDRS